MAQFDITEFVQTVTVEEQPVSLIALEIGKLEVRPGDVLTIRRADGVSVSRTEAARIREAVLKAFENAGFKPALLFVDGYEVAVIRGGDGEGGHHG